MPLTTATRAMGVAATRRGKARVAERERERGESAETERERARTANGDMADHTNAPLQRSAGHAASSSSSFASSSSASPLGLHATAHGASLTSPREAAGAAAEVDVDVDSGHRDELDSNRTNTRTQDGAAAVQHGWTRQPTRMRPSVPPIDTLPHELLLHVLRYWPHACTHAHT